MVHAVTHLSHAVGTAHKHAPAHTQHMIEASLTEIESLLRHGRVS
jgi:hypothetical protein